MNRVPHPLLVQLLNQFQLPLPLLLARIGGGIHSARPAVILLLPMVGAPVFDHVLAATFLACISLAPSGFLAACQYLSYHVEACLLHAADFIFKIALGQLTGFAFD